MGHHPRLWKRNGVYYHRATIPADLVNTYPKREETFSLRTKDYREAVKRLRVAAAVVDECFAAFRSQVRSSNGETNREVERREKPDMESLDLLDAHVNNFACGVYQQIIRQDEQYRHWVDGDGPASEQTLPGYQGKALMDLEACKRRVQRGLMPDWINKPLASYLTDRDWTVNSLGESPARAVRQKFLGAASRAEYDACHDIKCRYDGVPTIAEKYNYTIGTLKPADTLLMTKSVLMLSEVIPLWVEEKERNAWNPTTSREHQTWVKGFISHAGDKPIDQYTKADAKAFKETLMALAPNWGLRKDLKHLSIRDAALEAKRLKLKPMSDKNVNKLLQFVGSLWNWMIDNYDEVTVNPFSRLQIKLTHSAREEREPFSDDELKAIFTSPIYKGCRSVAHYTKSGTIIPTDSGLYWAPLIALYTGMRMQEILQLHTEDIKHKDGVDYIDINENHPSKQLKNANAKRVIPIHPKLVDHGFLELVSTRRDDEALRLFPDIQPGKNGKYAATYSKQFRRLLDAIGIKRPKINFHSFRHNFEDACREASVDYEIMNTLQGHSMPGMSARYGWGQSLTKLAESVGCIQYSQLNALLLSKA